MTPHTHGRVLIVDDDPRVVRHYGQQLRDAGFVVFGLTDRSRLAEVLATNEVDVLLNDLAPIDASCSLGRNRQEAL